MRRDVVRRYMLRPRDSRQVERRTIRSPRLAAQVAAQFAARRSVPSQATTEIDAGPGPPPAATRSGAAPVTFVVMRETDLVSLVASVVAAVHGEAHAAATATDEAPQTPEASVGTHPHPVRPDAATPPLRDLTPRELDVLELVAKGLDNRSIARALGISHRTVRNHLNSIFSKLGVTYRPQALVMAREAGLGRA